MVYKLECNERKSIFVGQIVRHLTTRVKEHRKADSPVGQYLKECGGDSLSSELSWKIIDQANSNHKFLTLEALHIFKEKPGLNARDEIRSSELT